MNHFRHIAVAAVGGAMLTAACAFSAPAFAAGPEVVAGPAADPGCFAPWTDKTKFFKFPAKKGPFRIALANGFIANTWRIQMIQTAKAFAAQPDDCGPAQGVQSRLDRRGRRRANRRDQQFHRFRLRRDRRQCSESVGVQAGHQARQRRRRHPGRVRQHSRHRGRDQRRRRPEGSWRLLGSMAGETYSQWRQGSRSARRLGHLGRPRPS